jgi:hypothetical protein
MKRTAIIADDEDFAPLTPSFSSPKGVSLNKRDGNAKSTTYGTGITTFSSSKRACARDEEVASGTPLVDGAKRPFYDELLVTRYGTKSR